MWWFLLDARALELSASDDGELGAALTQAIAQPGDHVVFVAPGTYTEERTLTAGLAGRVRIRPMPQAEAPVVFQADRGDDGFFLVDGNVILELHGVEIDGMGQSRAARVVNGGGLDILFSYVHDTHSNNGGGAVAVGAGSFVFASESLFEGSTAARGGFFSGTTADAQINLRRTTLRRGTATSGGGGAIESLGS
ncbi:MAG: hypothetical protein KC656_27975, partial [Myxococcales bacterium]|nr:hypothetical protein [Myxococcales bacterium]